MEHRYIEESGTMNVFFRIGDTLLTPETGGTILEGITRDSIIRLAEREGIPTEVRKVEVKEVLDAIANGTLKEAFGAGTAATIAHMSSIAFEGGEYQLPAPEEFTYANRLARLLDDVRRGRADDTFGWNVHLP